VALGRPREFDRDQALDRALDVFWRHGYEGASIAELTQAMGINPPSLYAAFGNKEALFRQALDRYASQRTAFWDQALGAASAREMVEQLLYGTADFLTDDENPSCCMFVRGATSCGEAEDVIKREFTTRRAKSEAELAERLERAPDLPPGLEPVDFARYIMTVLEGMSVQAASGANRDQLRRVAETTLRIWPVSGMRREKLVEPRGVEPLTS
jgi:AcrR family transcriptional regulator